MKNNDFKLLSNDSAEGRKGGQGEGTCRGRLTVSGLGARVHRYLFQSLTFSVGLKIFKLLQKGNPHSYTLAYTYFVILILYSRYLWVFPCP
jgi:hypothetical protein